MTFDPNTGLLGGIGLANIIVLAVAWGRLNEQVKNLCGLLNKQNGRVTKLEEKEEACKLQTSNDLTKLQERQDDVRQRLTKLEKDLLNT